MMRKQLLSVLFGAVAAVLPGTTALGAQLYAISGAGHTESILYELDPATGAVIQTIGNSGVVSPHHITSLACQPTTGKFFGYVNEYVAYNEGQLATIDLATGLATVLSTSSPVHVPDMTFDPDGTLYGWTEGGTWFDDLIKFDTSTGAVTQVGDALVSTARTGLASDSNGKLYMKAAAELYTVDKVTGVATPLITLSQDLVNALAFDENDELYSVDRVGTTSYLMKIDIATGNVSTVGDMGVANIAAIEFSCGGPVQSLENTWGRVKALYR